MTTAQDKWLPITVSSKTLGHLSRGIYRGPASAVRELVSNAFDAGALTVEIQTGFPSFDVFSVRDDGAGMTATEFSEYLQGGVGDSSKREAELHPIGEFGRPIIGRIGIGLLAFVQLGEWFTVESHHRASRTAFRAQIKIRDILRRSVDADRTAERRAPAEPDAAQGYKVGEHLIERIPYSADMAGTLISTDVVREVITSDFGQTSAGRAPEPLPRRYSRFLARTLKCRAVGQLGAYWKFAWDLATLAPLPYPEDGPVEEVRGFAEVAQRLVKFRFRVVVDGLSLKRPVVLPNPEAASPDRRDLVILPFVLDETVSGDRLRVVGYFFAQATKLNPLDLAGLLVRLKHVAVGYRDRSLMNYDVAEGPRMNWVSGEVCVLEGLEDALNIDRESFNQSDPHFRKLQEGVRAFLHGQFFPKVLRKLARRRKRQQEQRDRKAAKTFRLRTREAVGVGYAFTHAEMPSDEWVRVDTRRKIVTVNDQADWPRLAAQRRNAQQAAVVFELARAHAELGGTLRERFFRLLTSLAAED